MTTIRRSDGWARLTWARRRGATSLPIVPWLADHVVAVAVLAVVALRLPMIANPPGLDESGYLLVAGQWHAGGSSLYGDYWVDRPPMLISIFAAAAHAGGLVTLRLIGCLAAALVVLGAAYVARRVAIVAVGSHREGWAGARASRWAAVVAAALCVNPSMGANEVNGELLAAPFVVWGVAAAVTSIRRTGDESSHLPRSAAVAGAASVAALLVKQNFADGGVFMAAALAVLTIGRTITPGQAARIWCAFAGGALACLVVMSGWTLLHGTSLRGVYHAMYPFRIAAGRVLSSTSDPAMAVRRAGMIRTWLTSGIPVVMILTLVALVTRRVRSAALWALVAVFVFDLLSIQLGGGYWPHYLLQLVVPVTVCAGVLTTIRQRGLRVAATVAAAAVAVIGVVAWANAVPEGTGTHGSSLGRAIGAVSRPRDTIVTIYGHSDVTMASGLRSPYPYLWTLPARTLDPKLRLLDQVLTGSHAPTWFVTWAPSALQGVDGSATARLVARRYHPVARLWDHLVYLRDGVSRTPPHSERPAPPRRTPGDEGPGADPPAGFRAPASPSRSLMHPSSWRSCPRLPPAPQSCGPLAAVWSEPTAVCSTARTVAPWKTSARRSRMWHSLTELLSTTGTSGSWGSWSTSRPTWTWTYSTA
ncbi:MAG: hypothetical protein JWQ15_654 [Marmoricola sp.]|nr:hypothetical protein [Marmoricola sp.]